MPIPIEVPTGKLAITESENLEAEGFLGLLLQVMRSGTQGTSIITPGTKVPIRNAPKDLSTGLPAVESLVLDTADKQLFFRQLSVALAVAFSPTNVVIPPPPPYLAQTYTSAGVTKGDGVILTSTGVVGRGSNGSDAGSLLVGLAKSSIAEGDTVSVIAIGTFQGALVGATLNTEYFLGPTGQPVLFSALTAGQRIIRLGFASSPTDLEVRIMDLGVR